MYSWTCTCGDGAASSAPSWDDARIQGEMHTCRAGRLRDEHVVIVRASAAEA